MGMTITRKPTDRRKPLKELAIGDTFMYDERLGIVVDIDSHRHYLSLPSGYLFREIDDYSISPSMQFKPISDETLVLPTQCEIICYTEK